MKVYIMNDSPKLISEIVKANSKFNYEIVGTGPINDTKIKDVAISRVDVLIVGQIDEEEARKIISASPNINIVMLANDINRAQELYANLLKDNIKNYNYVDINRSENGVPTILKFIQEQFGSKSEYDIDSIALPNFDEDFELPRDEIVEETVVAETVLDSSNSLEEELQVIEKPKYDPVNNLKTKVIHFHSKKGGVGRTLLVKEVGNQFSAIKLPKKLNRKDEYLRTCVLDLDFERGNLRCHLGVLQPYPSVYDWIEDIVSLLEKGFTFDKIKYSHIQVVSQYARKIRNGLYAVPTAQGEIPSKLYKRIEHLDNTGKFQEGVLKLICDKIIDSLRGLFDILVIDSPAGINECSMAAYENSDANILVLTPTLSAFENTKVLLDELSNFDLVNPSTLGLLINKDLPKTGLEDEIEDMLKFLTINAMDFDEGKKVKKTLPLCGYIPYSNDVILFENSYSYLTDGNNAIKQGVIKLCEYILPVFKIKTTVGGVSRATILKEKKNKKKNKQETQQTVTETKTETEDRDFHAETDEIIGKVLNEETNRTENTEPSEQIDQVEDEIDLVVQNATSEIVLTKKMIVDMNFDKNVTVENFIETLKKVENIQFLGNGVPYFEIKPRFLPDKVWKGYIKASIKKPKKK